MTQYEQLRLQRRPSLRDVDIISRKTKFEPAQVSQCAANTSTQTSLTRKIPLWHKNNNQTQQQHPKARSDNNDDDGNVHSRIGVTLAELNGARTAVIVDVTAREDAAVYSVRTLANQVNSTSTLRPPMPHKNSTVISKAKPAATSVTSVDACPGNTPTKATVSSTIVPPSEYSISVASVRAMLEAQASKPLMPQQHITPALRVASVRAKQAVISKLHADKAVFEISNVSAHAEEPIVNQTPTKPLVSRNVSSTQRASVTSLNLHAVATKPSLRTREEVLTSNMTTTSLDALHVTEQEVNDTPSLNATLDVDVSVNELQADLSLPLSSRQTEGSMLSSMNRTSVCVSPASIANVTHSTGHTKAIIDRFSTHDAQQALPAADVPSTSAKLVVSCNDELCESPLITLDSSSSASLDLTTRCSMSHRGDGVKSMLQRINAKNETRYARSPSDIVESNTFSTTNAASPVATPQRKRALPALPSSRPSASTRPPLPPLPSATLNSSNELQQAAAESEERFIDLNPQQTLQASSSRARKSDSFVFREHDETGLEIAYVDDDEDEDDASMIWADNAVNIDEIENEDLSVQDPLSKPEPIEVALIDLYNYPVIKHGRGGKPKRVYLSVDRIAGVVRWGEGDRNLRIEDVKQIRSGKQTRVWKRRQAKGIDSDLCLSLVTLGRTLDIQLKTREERHLVMSSLMNRIIDYLKQQNVKAAWTRPGDVAMSA